MSEAPERIWAWWDDAYDVGLLNKHGDKRYTPNDAKEYVRADRIEELEAKLKAKEKLVLALAGDKIDLVSELAGVKGKLAKVTEELEEYKWMYEDLCE